MSTRWKVPPTEISREIRRRADRVRSGTMTVATSNASKAQSRMKENAPWTDRTGDARAGLYAEARQVGDSAEIELGTRSDHGGFLELGTSRMAPRPVIRPTMDEIATEAAIDLANTTRREFGG